METDRASGKIGIREGPSFLVPMSDQADMQPLDLSVHAVYVSPSSVPLRFFFIESSLHAYEMLASIV